MAEKMSPWSLVAGSASDFVKDWLNRKAAADEAEKNRDQDRDEAGKDRRLTQDEMILELIMKSLENKFMNARDEQKHQATGAIAERGLIQSRSPMDRPISMVTALDKPRTYAAAGGTGASMTPGGEALSPEQLLQLAPQNFAQWQSISQQAHQEVGAMGLTDPLAKRPENMLQDWQQMDPGSYGRTVAPPGVAYANQRGDYLGDKDIADFQAMQAAGKTTEEIKAEMERRQRAAGMGN